MYKEIFNFIEPKNRFILILFLILSIFAAFMELLSLSSIPVFLMAILNPNFEELFFYKYIPFNLENISQQKLLLYLSIILCSIFFIKNIYLSFLSYFQGLIQKKFQVEIGKKMFKYYIESDYSSHVNKNPSIILRTITGDSSQTASIILNYTNLMKEFLVLLGIFIMLLFIDFTLTISVFVFLSFLVIIFFMSIKKKIFNKAKEIQLLSGQQLKNINQMLSSIKEIKLQNKEEYFKILFSNNMNKMESNRLFNFFFTNLPRYYLETISIFTITLVTLFFVYSGRSFENFVPLLSLLAVSAIRLIPSFNIISSSLSRIKSLKPSFEFINKELQNKNIDIKFEQHGGNNLNLQKKGKIFFKNISFKYLTSNSYNINNLNTHIELGKNVGILGFSGSGKTTFIDILLGLLKPTKGNIFYEDNNIFENINSWQKQIGYVPQEINLLDDTIASNIALGQETKSIDFNYLDEILEIVGLDKIINKLPKKHNTIVGNRGARLSGGQIQRIGIARALYLKPKILILDEALNSLDQRSENEILDNIEKIDTIKTIILISHNIELFKRCDNLKLIEDGNLVFDSDFNSIKDNYYYKKLLQENIKLKKNKNFTIK